jgi:spore maturation protein CgeB
MKLVVFGLTVSSSWGNGHATLWRGLINALARRGHRVVFFERDVPYYAEHRDLTEIEGGALRLYGAWREALPLARRELADADAAMVTSFCPDGRAASRLVLESRVPARGFYDLDTPVTLAALDDGLHPDYLPAEGLGGFDIVLSYTGGAALTQLRTRLGARRVAALYGHVDPAVHRPVAPLPHYRADLSYLGTYASDRQKALEGFLVDPAKARPEKRFVIGGAQYPRDFPWGANIFFVRHLPPSEHPAFFSSSRLTLNVTRAAMATMGWCPSGRLFEAASCGCPVLSDHWEGLETFFEPGREILVARDRDDAIAALDLSDAEAKRLARAARDRVLAEHTSERRAEELLEALGTALVPMMEA